MKQIFAVVALGWIGAMTWVVGDALTADALAMGIGVVLGVAAGLPVSLLILASTRRSERRQAPPEADRHRPPVVVLYDSRARPSGRLPGPERRQAPPIGLDARHRLAVDDPRRRWVGVDDDW